MIEGLKKLMFIEVFLIIFFYIAGSICLLLKLEVFYTISGISIFTILVLFYRTVILVLKTIQSEIEDSYDESNIE